MGGGICLNALNLRHGMSQCSLYDIIKMRNGTILNTFYVILLKWELVYIVIIVMWYNENEKCYVSVFYLRDITKMR